jgi:hypothetical protein
MLLRVLVGGFNLAVRRLLVGHGWWVRRLLDIGMN